MHHYKHDQRPKLERKECVSLVKSKITCLKERMKESKRICNCHCLIHKEKCPLSPCIYNERRWPGSDVCPRTRKQYISAEDRAFLDGLNPKPAWWKKARGKDWAVRYRSQWQCKQRTSVFHVIPKRKRRTRCVPLPNFHPQGPLSTPVPRLVTLHVSPHVSNGINSLISWSNWFSSFS